jgi:hypothetical protein
MYSPYFMLYVKTRKPCDDRLFLITYLSLMPPHTIVFTHQPVASARFQFCEAL